MMIKSVICEEFIYLFTILFLFNLNRSIGLYVVCITFNFKTFMK